MLPPVLTVTLNPAIDLHMEIAKWDEAEPMRATSMQRAAGGKGINVSRVLAGLGVSSTAAVALGAPDAIVFWDLAQLYPFEILPLHINGATRTNITVATKGHRFKINQSGPKWSKGEWTELSASLIRAMPGRQWVVFSGALPPGVPENAYAQLIRAASKAGAKTAIDCEGGSLLAALAGKPDLVHINRHELAAALKKKTGQVRGGKSMHDAALDFIKRGAQLVVVSDGAEECTLASTRVSWSAMPPKIKARGAMGAGDAMLAGMVAAFMSGKDPQEALNAGVKCGAECASKDEIAVG